MRISNIIKVIVSIILFTGILSAFHTIKQEQDNKISNLEKNINFTFKDSTLLKARYYLELANINSHWSDDNETTKALLENADNMLANIHTPDLYPIRQAIANEITQVQAIPALDLTGLLSSLDAAQNIISTLTLKNPFVPINVTETPATPSPTNSNWREHLQESLRSLEKLVIIRHHDDDVKSILTPEYALILGEKIRLNLQAAQWALLQKNQQVLQLSLKQAIENIQQIYDENNATTQSLIKQLQDIQELQLSSPSVSLEQSLLLLNKLIAHKDAQQGSQS